MKYFLIILFSLSIFFSCSDPASSEKNYYAVPKSPVKDSVITSVKDTMKETYKSGEVITGLAVSASPHLSYALYLPVGYKKSVSFPVIYFYDPQGNGAKPLEMYKKLADRYRFILVGSNDIRNGLEMEKAKQIALALWKDTHDKISITGQRGYLCGFSGGARYAGNLFPTLGANGIISCSAGFPMISPQVNPDMIFIGIAGLRDMNSLELRQQERVYDKAVSNAMLYFDGGHEWPPLETMNEAFVFLTAREIAFHKQIRTPIIDSLAGAFSEQFLFARKRGDTISEILALDKKIRYLSSAIDDKEEVRTVNILMNSAAWKKFLFKQKQEQEAESKQQQELLSMIQSGTPGPLEKKLEEIRKLSVQGKSGPVKFMNARLLGFVSLCAYTKAHEALKKNDLKSFGYFTHIYRTVDPSNPEQSYLTALLASSEGRCSDCVKYLEESVKLGFRDTLRFDTDPLLDKCRSSLKQVRINMGGPL
jgi:hypothetical protein